MLSDQESRGRITAGCCGIPQREPGNVDRETLSASIVKNRLLHDEDKGFIPRFLINLF